jgi:phosphatidate phosphatase APP1
VDRPKLPVPGLSALTGAIEGIDVVKVATTVDKAVNAGLIEVRRKRQLLRPTVVVTYRGWYADGVAHMTARCIEKPVFAAGTSVGMGGALKANLRRFLVLTIPGVTVRASMGEVTGEFVSDGDGYLHIELPVGDLSPGWHVVDIDPAEDSTVPHTTGRVLVPDPTGGLAVISDIDDTILKTGLTQRWTAAGRTFLRDVSDRKPVPGMAALYAGLSRGASGGKPAPFYYVSTGSWNYYDYLVAFLNLHRFPRGPLFLTDWGPRSDRLIRDGREHKRSTIRALLAANPSYDFVLVGDVGQGDPETYEVMAREFPGRIRAIFLVYVGSHLAQRSEAVAERAARLRAEEDIPMYYVADAVEAATAAWQLGLVDTETTEQVARALLDM